MSSFITRYMQYAKRTAAPPLYHRWCALACLAATVTDHVWVESQGEAIAPNLYVFMVGPSGAGKGVATSLAMRLLTHAGVVRIYNGMLTAQHLCDMLGRDKKHPPKILLVTEELSLCIGDQQIADRLIRLATALYSCSPYEFNEGTRTHGAVKFEHQCICWIAGTTPEWLRDSVPKSAIEGGFFARVSCIVDRGPLRRVSRPVLDLSVFQGLADDLRVLAQLGGPMTMTADADELFWHWYEERPAVTEQVLEPVWARVPVHVLKLATLLSLSDGPSMVISAEHITEARQLAEEALRQLPELIEYVSLTPETDGTRLVREAVQRAGVIHHTALARAMVSRGLTGSAVRDHLDTLQQSGLILREVHGQRVSYTWASRRLWWDDVE
jgi:hypothetical protein